MARTISGFFLVAWGLGVLVSGALRDHDPGTAYGAGQLVGWAFGLVLVAAGARAIVKGRAARR
jgi:hypothetical protein